MANKKISQLTAAAPLTGTEILPIVQGGSTVQATAQDIADLGGGGALPIVNTYPVTTFASAGTRFWYKGTEWHYMTQAEIDSTGWTGIVSIGFPAPVTKVFNIDVYRDFTGIPGAPGGFGGIPSVFNPTIVDLLGLGNIIDIISIVISPNNNGTVPITTIRNVQFLKNIKDVGTVSGLNLRYNTYSATVLNTFFTDLPSTLLVCTIDVRNNPGSATCNPTIATAKGYTVITS
jgi:hypothetical protein